MPRVLMICYYYPPLITSGTTRSLAFSEHLPKSGWTPVILSVSNSKDPYTKSGGKTPQTIEIHRSSEWNFAGAIDLLHACFCRLWRLFGKDLKRNFVREWLAVPDTQLAWFSTYRSMILSSNCSVIYLTCSPFSSVITGLLVKFYSRKPLVVDFRDAWTLNPHIRHGRFHQTIIRCLEKIVIRYTDALILNSEGALQLYRAAYPKWKDKFLCLPNGYDQLTPVAKRDRGKTSPLVIMHIGSFYGTRSPRRLLEVLSEITREQPERNFEFIQVGGTFDEVDEFRDKIKLTIYDVMPREKALELMQNASLLYLKQGFEPGVKDYVAVAAKTYEYIATGLPILAEVPAGDNAEIVAKYASHAELVTAEEEPQAKAEIRAAILRVFAAQEQQEFEIKSSFIEEFSRETLTKKLAALFERLTSLGQQNRNDRA